MTDMAGGGGSAALVLVGCVSGIVLFQFLVSRRPGSLPSASGEMSTTRKDLHVQRKLQHAGTGLLIYVATRLFPWRTASAVLMLCALAFLALHGARAASKRVDALFLRCFHGILRRDEAQRRAVPAAFFFLLGAALVLALYSPALARLAILHVSVGDPAASYVGVRFGRRQLPNWGVRRRDGSSGKSVEGLVGCWGVASLATLVALVLERDYYKVADLSAAAGLALMAGAGAAIAEATDVGVDDNLSLPLLSGLFMQAGVAVLAAV